VRGGGGRASRPGGLHRVLEHHGNGRRHDAARPARARAGSGHRLLRCFGRRRPSLLVRSRRGAQRALQARACCPRPLRIQLTLISVELGLEGGELRLIPLASLHLPRPHASLSPSRTANNPAAPPHHIGLAHRCTWARQEPRRSKGGGRERERGGARGGRGERGAGAGRGERGAGAETTGVTADLKASEAGGGRAGGEAAEELAGRDDGSLEAALAAGAGSSSSIDPGRMVGSAMACVWRVRTPARSGEAGSRACRSRSHATSIGVALGSPPPAAPSWMSMSTRTLPGDTRVTSKASGGCPVALAKSCAKLLTKAARCAVPSLPAAE